MGTVGDRQVLSCHSHLKAGPLLGRSGLLLGTGLLPPGHFEGYLLSSPSRVLVNLYGFAMKAALFLVRSLRFLRSRSAVVKIFNHEIYVQIVHSI
ncbi:hypothetical protein DPMN_102286 [Dreissena polymorpha]|uniref:Uncharacterized protein n=1 Tax=Dreissena polymorpha TaxID=45954 RepID=A0A9D4R8Z2_DREPO|nr:hypothetical protein DPMN_102286 [Dreissena polymorpha]